MLIALLKQEAIMKAAILNQGTSGADWGAHHSESWSC